ncbi:MAG: glycerol-3-phosphate dehydrogenase [Rhodobacterales bacterium]|nr:MAG: glycerol-3-phosphate dehydrogenase [Rhodobacterales bacterium]
MSISVLGAGAFGTALAISLARNGQAVTLWARDAASADQMQRKRENGNRLAGHPFPDSITATADLSVAVQNQTLLLAIPAQKLGGFSHQHAALLDGKALVACCKGIDLATGLGPVETLDQSCPNAVTAILTGPSFAADIAKGLPTALTLACADNDMAGRLQAQLSTDSLRLYRSSDTIGAELGGALKNVIAIACGATIGAGLGESARAAVMTRGYAEIQRLAGVLGAQPQTLSGLSGFGDLTLTCTSAQSRNYTFGMALGRGDGFDKNITVEGIKTAFAVSNLAKQHGIEMPITRAITAVLGEKISVQAAMQALLARPLKEE